MRSYIYLLSLLLTAFILVGCDNSEIYHTITGYAQGGTYQLTYSDRDSIGKKIDLSEHSLKRIIDAAFLDIDNSMSGYNKESTLTKINNNESVKADSLFLDILAVSAKYYQETGGCFDVTSAPLFDIWGFGFSERENVDSHKIDSLLMITGMDMIVVDNGRVIKQDPRVRLNFNAIAQGYACDYVAGKLMDLGYCHFLLEMGGEIFCKGLSPRGSNWRIAIDAPIDGNMSSGENIYDVIETSDCGVVTSGNYRKFYIENGVKYSHTIDPRTGYPVKHNLLSATVIAENATIADIYATYLMVIGLEEAIAFLESREDLEGYLIYMEDDVMKTYFTSGFDK